VVFGLFPKLKIYKTSAVFGLSRNTPMSYTERSNVDDKFMDSITSDKHIVIHGSSKQGKTSLRKHCLKQEDYICLTCSNNWSISNLNANILKGAGFKIPKNVSHSEINSVSLSTELAGEVGIPLTAKASAKTARSMSDGGQKSESFKPIDVDFNDVNDIISALKAISFDKYIIIEDFHYLAESTQRDFAIALKAYHENSDLIFIVIGVWRGDNRLTVHNGDLLARVVSIDADTWSDAQIKEMIANGEKLLNVKFSEGIKNNICKYAHSSIMLAQEACLYICKNEKIIDTQKTLHVLHDGHDVNSIIGNIVSNDSARYQAFIDEFSDGSKNTKYEMYKWLIFAVLSADSSELINGIKRNRVSQLIRSKHPVGDSLNEGNITQALQHASSLQVSKGVRPIIIDYDAKNKKLDIVDRSFYVWLTFQNRPKIINDLLSL
jgi:hypothetical protein